MSEKYIVYLSISHISKFKTKNNSKVLFFPIEKINSILVYQYLSFPLINHNKYTFDCRTVTRHRFYSSISGDDNLIHYTPTILGSNLGVSIEKTIFLCLIMYVKSLIV